MKSNLPTFRHRLTSRAIKVAAVALTVFAILLLAARPLIIKGLADGYLIDVSDYINKDMQYVFLVNDSVTTQTYLDDTLKLPWIMGVALKQKEEIISYAGVLNPSDDVNLGERIFKVQNSYAHTQRMKIDAIPSSDEDATELTLYMDATSIVRRVNSAYLTLTTFLVAFGILLLFMISRLAKTASQSISDLTLKLQAINRDNDASLPSFQKADSREIEYLQTTLLESIESSIKHQTELENAVAQRTVELNDALKANMVSEQMRNSIIMNLSHDLRTPLTSNLGYIDHVIEQLDDDTANKEILKKARHQGLLLSKEIGSLTQVSISDDIGSLVVIKHTDICSLINDCIDDSDQLRQSSNNSVVFRHVENCTVYTSKRLLRFVIDNLLSNAHKYCINGEVYITVNIESTSFEIVVADTGKGIPDGEMEKVFEKHYQSDTNGKVGSKGVGIGLALSKLWVELLNGQITLTKNPKGHTEFTVKLPNKPSL